MTDEKEPQIKELLLYIAPWAQNNAFVKSLEMTLGRFLKMDFVFTREEYYNLLKKNKYGFVMLEFFPGNNYDEFDADYPWIKDMIIAAKKAGSTVMCSDGENFAYYYMKAGCDYFANIRKHSFDIGQRTIIIKEAIKNGKISGSYRDLVIEKKEFYDSAIDIFNERSKITADKEKEFRFLVTALNHNNSKSVLDVGCGAGRISEPLAKAGFNVVGIDINENLIKKAIKIRTDENNPKYFITDLLNNPIKNAEFDAALMMWHVVCEFREHQDALLAEINRLIKRNGILIFDFPDVQKKLNISDEGVYEDEGSGLRKYVGLVPKLSKLIMKIEYLGFKVMYYKRLTWGIRKYVVVAQKL